MSTKQTAAARLADSTLPQTTEDMGNNEGAAHGIFKNDDGSYTALLPHMSREYKTIKGAAGFLARYASSRYGYLTAAA